ncbi:MAG: winged helix-turn-helix transcriptional regulator [Planctomycetaceae bacterium]|nr:winged helix-turn-helix transcriptional regulator [Planctomycetaceae bacterium]
MDSAHTDRMEAARRALPGEDILREVSGTFRLLSHPARLRILLLLQTRELCVCDLSALLGLPMPETVRHLRRLRSAGAVTYRTEGKIAYYRLACPSWPRLVAKAIAEGEERGAHPGLRRAAGRRP